VDSDQPDTLRSFRGQQLTPEQAGDVFERWILEAFRLSGMTGHYSYRVPMRDSGNTREQIDGMVFDGWQSFLVEAKFWPGNVDFGPIALLHSMVESRPVGTLGLFFSAFGFTVPALESAGLLRPSRVLLFDYTDIDWALGKRSFKGRMLEMVRREWMLAVKNGSPQVVRADTLKLFNSGE
jgi:Restriction endonuclease